MHLKTFGMVLCGLALLLLTALPAAADLTVKSKVTTKKDTYTQTTYITKDYFRAAGPETDVIYELATGRMIQIDHKKKRYFVTSLQEISAQMAEFSKMIEETPMLGRMLGDLAASVDVRKAEGSRTILGYDCQHYILEVGKVQVDMWVTPELLPPGSYHDAQKLMYAQMGPMAKQFDKLIDEMKEINGYSLASRTEFSMMGRDTVTEEEAIEVSQDPIPASTFEVPAGYKEKKSPYAK